MTSEKKNHDASAKKKLLKDKVRKKLFDRDSSPDMAGSFSGIAYPECNAVELLIQDGVQFCGHSERTWTRMAKKPLSQQCGQVHGGCSGSRRRQNSAVVCIYLIFWGVCNFSSHPPWLQSHVHSLQLKTREEEEGLRLPAFSAGKSEGGSASSVRSACTMWWLFFYLSLWIFLILFV